jgi:hypothetical protein
VLVVVLLDFVDVDGRERVLDGFVVVFLVEFGDEGPVDQDGLSGVVLEERDTVGDALRDCVKLRLRVVEGFLDARVGDGAEEFCAVFVVELVDHVLDFLAFLMVLAIALMISQEGSSLIKDS